MIKSRLGWEFETYADGLSATVRWHSGRCLSYGEGVAFFALAEAIRGRLQLVSDDALGGDEDQGVLLEVGLDRYVPDPEETHVVGAPARCAAGRGCCRRLSARGSFLRLDDLPAPGER